MNPTDVPNWLIAFFTFGLLVSNIFLWRATLRNLNLAETAFNAAIQPLITSGEGTKQSFEVRFPLFDHVTNQSAERVQVLHRMCEKHKISYWAYIVPIRNDGQGIALLREARIRSWATGLEAAPTAVHFSSTSLLPGKCALVTLGLESSEATRIGRASTGSNSNRPDWISMAISIVYSNQSNTELFESDLEITSHPTSPGIWEAIRRVTIRRLPEKETLLDSELFSLDWDD